MWEVAFSYFSSGRLLEKIYPWQIPTIVEGAKKLFLDEENYSEKAGKQFSNSFWRCIELDGLGESTVLVIPNLSKVGGIRYTSWMLSTRLYHYIHGEFDYYTYDQTPE